MSGQRIVVLGLSITSSWGNGHATTYRSLVRGLHALGHDVLFLERDVPWYADNRDMPAPPGCRLELYHSLDDLMRRFAEEVEHADAVMVGSYVPDGVEVIRWVHETARGTTVFYDIDTPVTLEKLRQGEPTYISPDQIARFDAYLSFTGGPTLDLLQKTFGARAALPLYCSVDPELYLPQERPRTRDLGYLGTYSDDRQPTLDRMLTEAARRWSDGRFVVAGSCYPSQDWPPNVERLEHVPPGEHPAFYGSQRFTLNVTRRDMIKTGHSPSVRLFEAAACGVPVISDVWAGIEELFEPNREILLANTADEVLHYLRDLTESERVRIGERAREKVLAQHTAFHRARQLEQYLRELGATRKSSPRASRIPAARSRRPGESAASSMRPVRASES